MKASSHAPFYDLFKLIVAIILLIIFLFLIWIRPTGSTQTASSIETSTPPPPTPTVASPTETFIPPTATLPAPSETPVPTDTPVPTATLSLPPISSPEGTEQPADEPLPTPIIEIPADLADCQTIAQSQLQVGGKATVQRKVNFRSSPGIFNNIFTVNLPGTEVDVIGGPACTRYKNGGAYLWWQIQLPNGLTGWSAEASAFGAFYFMEPSQ